MREQTVVIGIDGGTTAVKAIAFGIDGTALASASHGVPVCYGRGGHAEQDMEAVWQAVASCLRSVTSALEGAVIAGVGVTAQGDGAWMVDREGTPVGPAATWLDSRAAGVVSGWVSGPEAEAIRRTTGTTVFPGLFPALWAELRRTSPDVTARAAHQLACKDWIRLCLTGEYATDYTDASRTLLDIVGLSGYSEELAHLLGEEECLGLLAPIHHADRSSGTVTAEAAAATGLPPGIPVATGMIDVSACGVGLGAVADGQGWTIVGTTDVVGVLRPSAGDRATDLSMVVATGRGRQVLEFLAPMTGAPNLDWARSVLGLGERPWNEVDALARQHPAGSGGVLFLPYGAPGGERAPFLDMNASSSWLGMSIETVPGQLIRAAYEGVAFALHECQQLLGQDGDVVVSGGAFHSDILCEILANVTGRRVLRSEASEAGARGAATEALVASGLAPDEPAAIEMLQQERQAFEPDPDEHAAYQDIYAAFVSIRDAQRPTWPGLRMLRDRADHREGK
jgi:xylulokinase